MIDAPVSVAVGQAISVSVTGLEAGGIYRLALSRPTSP
jgi:hypothetical protein